MKYSSVFPNSIRVKNRSALKSKCPVTRNSTACHNPGHHVPAASDNTSSSQLNKHDPIGSSLSVRRQTHILTGCIAREVPHGTSQLSPHFKSDKTPHPGTAWLDGSTRTVTALPFLLTSLSWQRRPLFSSQLSLLLVCFVRVVDRKCMPIASLTASHVAPHFSVLSVDQAHA